MKKLFAYITTSFLLLGLLPAVAYADLQCYSSTSGYTKSVNVQNASQCTSFDTSDPKPRLLDTSTNTWTDPATGAQTYTPGYSCVGLAPAFRMTEPAADGGCTVGYKLGKVTTDQNGNVTKVNYADGSVETSNPVTGKTTYTTAGSAPTATSGNGGPRTLTYTPLEPLPGQKADTYASLSAYLTLMFNILLSIGAMVAVVTLVLAGITYMVSEVVDKKLEARRRIQASFIGLLLLLTCWLILYTVNPNLTRFSLLGLDQSAHTQQSAPLQINYGSGSATNDQNAACQSQGKTMHSVESGWICI